MKELNEKETGEIPFINYSRKKLCLDGNSMSEEEYLIRGKTLTECYKHLLLVKKVFKESDKK